jgi:hypothetical protein
MTSNATITFTWIDAVSGDWLFEERSITLPDSVIQSICDYTGDEEALSVYVGFPTDVDLGLEGGIWGVPTADQYLIVSGESFETSVSIRDVFEEPLPTALTLPLGAAYGISDYTFTCEDTGTDMTKLLWQATRFTTSTHRENLATLFIAPPIPPDSCINWQCGIQILDFEPYAISWTGSQLRRYDFGTFCIGYHGFWHSPQVIHFEKSYFGIYEALPSITGRNNPDPLDIQFGQRDLTRTRANEFYLELQPTVKASIAIWGLAIYTGIDEYI